jgi:PAS domain S-box-containing protein
LDLSSRFGAERDGRLQVLWADGERRLCRVRREGEDGAGSVALVLLPASEHPSPGFLDRLAHEYEMRDALAGAWAVRPLALERESFMLVLEDPGGEPLERLLGAPMAVASFLPLAAGIAASLGKFHARGLVHKDLTPAHLLVNCADGEVRLTGFGLASPLRRERQAPGPPEFIAGTLAYMAPEQTGRMNRSIDQRSDLYALGVVLYRMLTGALPFTAADPMEWVHCHIARKPVPPSERVENIPAPLSDIVMKLLAKTAEERYQTAAGLERDLRRSAAEWEAGGRIEDFPLGEHDTPDRLLIPETLYGRAGEAAALLAAFERVVGSGAPELMLVCGYSGIGKSAVVHELHKALVPARGLFASGKFDQYQRHIPYATPAQAFRGLIRPLLGRSEAELAGWRDALGAALGPNAKLMTDLIPELKLIIGEPPPVPELPQLQAQSRFHLAFRHFVGVFAQADRPLALFLDDLQWLDPATLDLMEDLLTRPEMRHLLLIGAYRDNEVDEAHPLARRLATIRKAGARVHEIRLAPLSRADIEALIGDALRCAPAEAQPLAQLVHGKTGGNPFFAIQFLNALADEDLLAFDHGAARWRWDLGRIHAKGYTDNVVDLVVGKLTRLPAATQAALQELACIGNVAEVATLSLVRGTSEQTVHAELEEAVRQELILRFDGAYRFIHDRVREAAYSQIPAERRAAAHLRIGRKLTAHTPAEKREEAIFEIVNQLNRGAALITASEEREELALLNLIAGRRAMASTAYASALIYFAAGAALLAEERWERRHDLAFALELHRGECEFLTGALGEAEPRLAALATRAAGTVERATLACLRIDLYTALDQSGRAIAVGLDYLRHLGIDWSLKPAEEEALAEYQRIWERLGARAIEALIELPVMSDAASLATMDVLTKLEPPASHTDANLLLLITCRAVNLSLERGNCDASCIAYVRLAKTAGARFGDYQTLYRFGRLGYDLVEGRGLTRFQARTYMDFAYGVLPWTRHVRAARDLLRRAFEAADQTGDLTYAAYCGNQLNTNLLMAGEPLAEVEREAERGLAFAEKVRIRFVVDRIATQLGLIRTLRGVTPTFGSFDDAEFDEARSERRFSDNPELAYFEFLYWVRKLQARFLAGDYPAAVAASFRAQGLLWTAGPQLEIVEFHFYAALALAQTSRSEEAGRPAATLEALAAHHRQLAIWAANCPENFADRAALVGAEIARLGGSELAAERLYEEAIRAARAGGFVHQEALAHELAARFYAARGFEKIARLYWQDARYFYLRWGAEGKVRQLDEMHPDLREERVPPPTSTIGAPVEHLDLATVIKVSHSVSGEMVLEKLIDTLMRTAIEQAGAERGLLIRSRGGELRIEAEATTGGDCLVVQLREQPVTAAGLPESVLNYALRTAESVVLDDAAQPAFAADPSLRRRGARSVLCLPLIARGKLIGLLYLENSLASGVFAPGRIAVLKLLASQAAIALENARLYGDLAEREAKIRRLVEANIIGICIGRSTAEIIEANDAFLKTVGYRREDLAAGRLRWADLQTPESHERSERALAELERTGAIQPFEKEYLRKDGSRVPVLIGVAAFDKERDQVVAFVVDLTERKRAEERARESERQYHRVEMELAHSNRVAMMGQLSASIAHEVVGRIYALVKKAPPREDDVALNDAIREVIALTGGEVARNRVVLRTELAEGLPLVRGDRVQLQQVILNLILNAIEAMGGAGEGPRELWIGTGTDQSVDVRVTVRDSGPGLDPVKPQRLFEAFYTTKQGGLGMGLSICRSIIEAHGGRLWAEPNEPRGAVFRFTVPARS